MTVLPWNRKLDNLEFVCVKFALNLFSELIIRKNLYPSFIIIMQRDFNENPESFVRNYTKNKEQCLKL